MRAVAILTFGLAYMLVTTPLTAAQAYYLQIAGSYQGEVYNGSDMDPVTTIFTIDDNGRFRGEYVVDEENGEFRGSLSNIMFEDERTITVEWTDKFGEGYAVMEFARDYQSFTGEWSDIDGSSPLPWTGKR